MVGDFQKYENGNGSFLIPRLSLWYLMSKPDCPYVFRLRDLLPPNEVDTTDAQLKQINSVLLRHIGKRVVLCHY